ncbi:MAG: hypothetical protein JXB88_11570 [Spirochaetales bacterium]|nr:hypothetical protein [Spirochaetales bacterium]
MEKSGTIIAYALMFFILIAVFFFIPRDILKKSGSGEITREKPVTVSFSQVSNVYEAREEEQNRRVITVYVARFTDAQEVWMQIFDYANKLPLTWGGFTAVFFFDNPAFTPSVDYFTEGFEEIYEHHCIAGYWKYSNGTDIFKQYPFKRNRE